MSYKQIVISLLAAAISFSSCSSLEDDGSLWAEGTVTDHLVIVPDIQYYTNRDDRLKYLDSIVDFINDDENKISACIQVGDITYQNKTEQWQNAEKVFFSRISPDIVSIFCLGNHDYGNNGRSKERHSNIPSTLNPIADIKADNYEYENYVRFISIGERPFAVLVLEFAPRNEALEWANTIISSYPSINFIVLTHAFLNNEGELFDSSNPLCNNQSSPKSYNMGGAYINDSKEIFTKIISKNRNVKMVLCGHCVSKNFIEHIVIDNSYGDSVHCIMVNYQHYRDGGYGYVGLLNYSDGEFMLRSYSTFKKEYGPTVFRFMLEQL